MKRQSAAVIGAFLLGCCSSVLFMKNKSLAAAESSAQSLGTVPKVTKYGYAYLAPLRGAPLIGVTPTGPAEQAYVAAFWNSVAYGIGFGLVPLVYQGVVRHDFDSARRISTYLSLLWASYTAATAHAFQSLMFNQPELLPQLAVEMDKAVLLIEEALKRNDPELQRLIELYESGLYPTAISTPGMPQMGMITSQPAIPKKPAQPE